MLSVRLRCRKADKLLFPLCRTCAVAQQQEKCNHTNDDRALTGKWCSNEISLAVRKGYRILKIYEVWHFDETSDKLFKGYVKDFMKIKMESSAPPKEDLDDFKKKVKNHLGIDLGNIKETKGMRAVSKLCLNSLWGKFRQRINQTQTEYVVEPKDFYKILLNEMHEDINVQFLTKDMVQMSFNLKDQFVDNYNNTNIFVAAFTTSYAREMLHRVLDKLGDQVLGYDTDSYWYVDRPGGNTMDTGDSLEELTDELNGGHIIKWVATGPKSYAYETDDGGVTTKVKGFTLNYANGLKINSDVMNEIIRDPSKKLPLGEKVRLRGTQKTRRSLIRIKPKRLRYGTTNALCKVILIRYPTGFKKLSKNFLILVKIKKCLLMKLKPEPWNGCHLNFI